MPYFFKEVALSANQARELGIKATLLGGDGWPSDQLISMGGKAVEGSYFVNHLDYADPAVQDFKTRYRDKYGKECELNGFLAHDATILLVEALKKAGKPNGERSQKHLKVSKYKVLLEGSI